MYIVKSELMQPSRSSTIGPALLLSDLSQESDSIHLDLAQNCFEKQLLCVPAIIDLTFEIVDCLKRLACLHHRQRFLTMPSIRHTVLLPHPRSTPQAW